MNTEKMDQDLKMLEEIYKGSGRSFGFVETTHRRERKPRPFPTLEVGDIVEHYGIYGGGFTEDSKEKIIKKIHKYDEDTGNKYPIYMIESGQLFDGRDGSAIDPPLAYAIKKVRVVKKVSQI